MKTSLKDWPKVYERIKHVRGLDEHEKILYARSLAATPDERWHMNETYLRSFGLWGRSALKKFASNSSVDEVLCPRRRPVKRRKK
jgi:hypothetical protein